MLVFEAVMAVPLLSLSLLKTDGDGFGTQQFNTNLTMLLGVIIRPILMTIGLVLGLVAFNTIMQITNVIFAPAIANMTPSSDNSLLTFGIYVVIYTTTAYTLANSAFKMIDLVPNYVMAWIGARMETRVDDASMIQSQTQQYISTLAYSARGGMMGTGATKPDPAAGGAGTTKAPANVEK